jgi:PPP family 3-phenylpropionic acid transporter
MRSADEALPVATILSQARVRALFAACFAMSAAHGALYVFYSIHLADHHYSKFLVGCLWSLGVLAEIVVFFCMAACRAALACAPFCCSVLPRRSCVS